LLGAMAQGKERAHLVFSCAPTNDLCRVLSTTGVDHTRYESPDDAIHRAPDGSGVLMLADGYPDAPSILPSDLMSVADKKRLRVYAEYAGAVDSSKLAHRERGVVVSGFFGERLPPMRLLSLHACRFLAIDKDFAGAQAHVALAKVAGFDTAVFGMPEESYPLLVGHDRVLLATTQLSRFVTARYSPSHAWAIVWESILSWLLHGSQRPGLRWRPSVEPTYARSARLRAGAEQKAALRGAEWYYGARLFIHESWADRLNVNRTLDDRVGPAPTSAMPVGNGKLGMIEGHSSRIEFDGSQPVRWWIRADCVGETAMTLSLAHACSHKPAFRETASNLMHFLVASKMMTGRRSDPADAAYGLVGWNEADLYYKNENGYDVYYGDDNARCLLGALAASSHVDSSAWLERVWLAILANFRLFGSRGHQKSRYDQEPFAREGWRHWHDAPTVLHDMNYQAYPWALFLWTYSRTRYQPFLDRCLMGIRSSIGAYPDHWRWSNSITSQQARFILPLAWLVRVKDTVETRGWLKKLASDILRHQDASGAIFEWTGPRGTGIQTPPVSNAQYGAGEGTLIQQNSDPAADLLYAMNFAFIGLHEAYAATGDTYYRDAENRIADFLVRAQVRSDAHPQFDGAWYRAFDFKSWDYWASNSDAGWGAWCTESGWSQSWITSTFCLRQLRKSLWDTLNASPRFAGFDDLAVKMFHNQSK